MHNIDGWRILMILPMTAPYAPDGEGTAGFYIAAYRDVSGMDPLSRVFITAKVNSANLRDAASEYWTEVTPRVSEEHAMACALRAAGWNGIEKALMATTR